MISPRSQGPQPTPESASQTMVWVPAGNPRLTGIRVPPGLQGNPMGPAEYHRRLQFRVQAMMDQAGPEETLMALEALIPEGAAALEDAYPVQVAEILFEMTDSLTRATLAEQLARVAWPATPQRQRREHRARWRRRACGRGCALRCLQRRQPKMRSPRHSGERLRPRKRLRSARQGRMTPLHLR